MSMRRGGMKMGRLKMVLWVIFSGIILNSVEAEVRMESKLTTQVTAGLQKICWFSAETGRWPAEGNRVLPWVTAYPVTDGFWKKATNPITKAPGKRGFLVIGRYDNGDFGVIWPLPVFKKEMATVSWLETDAAGELVLRGSTLGKMPKSVSGRCLVLRGKSLTALFDQAGQFLVKEFPVQPRHKKVYPKPFRYLGWCSWEQFKKNINEDLLVNAADQITKSPLPIRWMLIDDGFQIQQGLKLKSFAPNTQKFPKGWETLMAMRNEKLKWMGLWHCFFGLWQGIDRNNQFSADVNKLLMAHNGRLYPGKDPKSTAQFYQAFMKSVADYGFDFVKIDVQCEYLKQLMDADRPVLRQYWSSRALNQACAANQLDLMNCMAMGSATSFLTDQTPTTRCSIDYKLGDLNMARSHLWQSYHNTLWMASMVYPDHDMFHSSDPGCGGVMARSKAVSAGPVYLSDAPHHFNAENIWPLVEKDGLLLRPEAPAFPVAESVLLDPLNEPVLYKVAAPLKNGSAVVVGYNLFCGKKTVTGEVTLENYREALAMAGLKLPQNSAQTIFSWNQNRGQVLSEKSPFSIKIVNFGDELTLINPIRAGWSVVGITDKYLSPLMVVSQKTVADQLEVVLKESGKLVIWSDPTQNPPKLKSGGTLKSLGDGFWEITEASGKVILTR